MCRVILIILILSAATIGLYTLGAIGEILYCSLYEFYLLNDHYKMDQLPVGEFIIIEIFQLFITFLLVT